MERRARVVLSIAEHLLERPVRTVLDVGCGEGRWLAAVRAVRPRARYVGVDPSAYAVRRFGRARNLRHGTIDDLAASSITGEYDVIICADVLHYLTDDEVRRGVRQIAERLLGVACMEVFTADDDFAGDRRGWRGRRSSWYRRLFRAEGLVPCGMHCYAAPALSDSLAALERLA